MSDMKENKDSVTLGQYDEESQKNNCSNVMSWSTAKELVALMKRSESEKANLGLRVKECRERLKVSQLELAEMTGLKQGTISDLERGKSKGTGEIAIIAAALNTTVEYLMYGIGEQNAVFSNANIDSFEDHEIPDGMVAVPFFNGKSLSAGSGALNSDIAYEGEVMYLSKKELSAAGAMPENVFSVTVKGDSMEPRYDEGGIVFVDIGQREIIDGKTYAISHGDQDYIKRLSRSGLNTVLVSSDNPMYKSYEVSINDIVIFGRVIVYHRKE